jgi:hypothetical protein
MVWVHERTIPTERPPLVGEVIANFLRIEGATWSAWRVRPYSRFSRQEPLLFYQVPPQLYSLGWVDPVPDQLPFFPGSAGNRTMASVSVAKTLTTKPQRRSLIGLFRLNILHWNVDRFLLKGVCISCLALYLRRCCSLTLHYPHFLLILHWSIARNN